MAVGSALEESVREVLITAWRRRSRAVLKNEETVSSYADRSKKVKLNTI